jgi:hypothetical protein
VEDIADLHTTILGFRIVKCAVADTILATDLINRSAGYLHLHDGRESVPQKKFFSFIFKPFKL